MGKRTKPLPAYKVRRIAMRLQRRGIKSAGDWTVKVRSCGVVRVIVNAPCAQPTAEFLHRNRIISTKGAPAVAVGEVSHG